MEANSVMDNPEETNEPQRSMFEMDCGEFYWETIDEAMMYNTISYPLEKKTYVFYL